MTFQLDTSGFVSLNIDGKVDPDWTNETAWTFANLTPFAQGYVEAMLASVMWGQQCKPCAGNGEIITDEERYLGSPQPGDTGDEGTATCSDCDGRGSRTVGFSDLAPETLAQIITDCASQIDSKGRCNKRLNGAGFWETRQKGYMGVAFPPLTVTLGDDGKVRF